MSHKNFIEDSGKQVRAAKEREKLTSGSGNSVEKGAWRLGHLN